ncbi:MAG TPA: endonuclease/exonuclease/phosphatase family protein [Blastocatellia bacterium]|jgi:Metal-dependent hydrolase
MQTYLKLIHSMLLLLLLFGLSSNSKAQSDIHVDRNGSAAPDASPAGPYQLLKAGVCRGPNGKIVIRPGVYNETLTIKDPMTLTVTGPAIIGQLAGKPNTKLKVVTYNTHLFGDEGAGRFPTFADRARAAYIADWLRLEDADVIGLQEVWDEELADAIVQRAGYQHHYYNNDHDELDDFLNSGLLLLSKYPLVNPSLTFYRDEVSISDCVFSDPLCPVKNPTEPWKCCIPYLDGFASKGIAQATIFKNGFQLGIFITHTQAEHHQAGVNARRKQLEQLGSQIQEYRAFNPGAEVIAMGDFNVIAGSDDYFNSLLRHTGLRDTYSNLAPCLDISLHQATCAHKQNDLARFFDNTAFDCDDKRLDYVLYSHGSAFDALPVKLEVRRYQAETSDDGKTMRDLSDHYGVAAEFSLWRNN